MSTNPNQSINHQSAVTMGNLVVLSSATQQPFTTSFSSLALIFSKVSNRNWLSMFKWK